MSQDIVTIKVPRLAESISEATLVEWLKPDGSTVRTDEPVATLETDKAAVEIVADAGGVLSHARKAGEVVQVGDVLGRIAAGNGATPPAPPAPPAAAPAAPVSAQPLRSIIPAAVESLSPATPPVTPAVTASAPAPAPTAPPVLAPSVRRIVEEQGLDPTRIAATGPGGRILKEDALRAAAESPAPTVPTPPRAPAEAAPAVPTEPTAPVAASADDTGDRVVPMSRIRLRIAERLVQAQHTAAILTTFNEFDMSRVIDVRARHKEAFEKRHGVKLGFMSFFARACIQSMVDVPAVNAEIRGTDIVYHGAVHLGIAVGTPRGLVVPVVRDAQALDLAGLEREGGRLAARARAGQLTPQEL